MDWFKAVDGYCERVDAAFWSEPINAITNVTFLIAAIWVWRRPELTVMGRVLTIILELIGIGSFLFHIGFECVGINTRLHTRTYFDPDLCLFIAS